MPEDLYLKTLTSTTARLIWDASENDFIAEHRLASASAWTQTHADDQTNSVWTFTGLTAGEDYLLRVRSKTGAGTSASAGPATDPILVNAAKTPGNVTFTVGDAKITVTWDDVTGAASYSVRHSGINPIAWTTATDKTSGYEITGLMNGTEYFVQVGAVLGGKTYWTAAPDKTAPSLPTGPHSNLAVQPRDGGLYATWTHGNTGLLPVPIANFYYRQGTTGNWSWWSSGACDTTGSAAPLSEHDCNVTGLTNGTVYQVRVYNTTWDEIIATGTPGPAPSGVTANAATGTSLSIAWTDATGATGHRLRHRATTSGNDGDWTVVTSPANPYTLSSLTADTEYDVQVGADHGTSDGTSTPACDGKDACGTHWSATVKATPSAKHIVLSESSRTVLENGGTADWTVKLSAQPTGNVTVKVTPSDNTAAKVCTGASCTPGDDVTLTFTSTNWNTAQTVTLNGQDDTAQNTGNKRDVTINHDTEGSNGDSGYDNKTGSVAARVVDDETATVASSFLSTVMVAGTREIGAINDVGYTSQAGQITSDSLSAPASGFTVSNLYIRDSLAGRPFIYVSKPATPINETRLPSPLDEGFVLQLGSGSSATWVQIEWISTGSYYWGVANSNASFTDGEIYEIHLIVPVPMNVAVAPDDTKLTVTWTDAAGAASHQVRYKVSTANDWTEPSGNESSGYEITGLTNGTEYDVQVGAVYGTGANARTYWSATNKATPSVGITLYSGTLEAGEQASWTGYLRANFGTLNPLSFNYPDSGTSNTINLIFHDSSDSELRFAIINNGRLPEASETGLKLHVGATPYDLSWVSSNNRYQATGVSSSPFTTGTSYTVKLTTEYLPAPAGFKATAGNAQVTLDWTGPDNVGITKWQYRQKPASSSESGYSAWTDISGGAAARSHTVTGLTNNTEYTFQIRAVLDNLNGPASDEMTATPDVPSSGGVFWETQMTAGLEVIGGNNWFGYDRDEGDSHGSMVDNTFSWDGTDYTWTTVQVGPSSVCVRTDPAIVNVDTFESLVLTVGDTDHRGTWSLGGSTTHACITAPLPP